MTRAPIRNDLGFTLVEVLVVLAVMALLTGLGVEALRAAADGWRRIETRDADAEELQSVEEMLRRLLSQIRPEKSGGASRRVVRFSGEARRLEFLAPLPERFGAADIVQYSVGFPTDGTLRIAWRLDRDVGGRHQDPMPGAEEFIDGITNASFTFLGLGEDGASGWWNNWNNKQVLPALIRLRLAFRGRERDLLIEPRITGTFCSTYGTVNDCTE